MVEVRVILDIIKVPKFMYDDDRWQMHDEFEVFNEAFLEAYTRASNGDIVRLLERKICITGANYQLWIRDKE